MRHLFSDWQTVLARIYQAEICCLLLDFDGTLTPIVAAPRLAVCPPEVKRVLEEMRDSPRFELAIISGRALDDIREKVGIDGITYVGNHGLGFQNPVGECRRYLSPQRQREFHLIRKELGSALGNFPGIVFEDKGAILAVHYRNVARELGGCIPKIMNRILGRWSEHWHLRQGKMVLEVCPRARFDKGKAAEMILKFFPQRDLLPIALGDDDSDEDVFRVIGNRGITVSVGNDGKNSEAEYFLNDPSETLEFLNRVAAHARKHGKPGRVVNNQERTGKSPCMKTTAAHGFGEQSSSAGGRLELQAHLHYNGENSPA
jgi:trehalose-phosphatase